MSCTIDIAALIKDYRERDKPLSDKQISQQLKALVNSGRISTEELKAFEEGKDITMTEQDNAKLDAYTAKIVKKNGEISIYEMFNTDELQEFIGLLKKAKAGVRGNEDARANFDRILESIDIISKANASVSVKVEDLLDKAIEKARLSGDHKNETRYQRTKDAVIDANDISKRMYLDFNAIKANNEKREKLLNEYALIKLLISIGTTETREKRNNIGVKIADRTHELKQFHKKHREGFDDLDPKDAVELTREENKKKTQIDKLRKELRKTETKDFAAQNKKLERRLKDIEIKLQKLNSSSPENFFAKAVTSALNIDTETYITSLRELKERVIRSEDNIKYVENIVESADDDMKFTLPFLEKLLGSDSMKVGKIKNFFYRPRTGEDVTDQDAATSQPVMIRKEYLTKEEVKLVVAIWKEIEKSRVYDKSYKTADIQVLLDGLERGGEDRQSVLDADPDDVHPIARTNEEAQQLKVGKQYDPKNVKDVRAAITDLNTFLARLTTLSSLPKYAGAINKGTLVAALGSDGQSLIHLFDSATADSLELDTAYKENTETSDLERQTRAVAVLTNLGFTPEEISEMPEFKNSAFKDTIDKVVSFDLEWEPGTNNIVSACLVIIVNGQIQETIQIYNQSNSIGIKPGDPEYKNETFRQEDAEFVLQQLHLKQNEGFKVCGHNIAGPQSDLNQLVIRSSNPKLAFSVGFRSFDTMLLAFRGSKGTAFSREYGPSLENLAHTYGIPFTKSIKAKDAFEVWKSGNLKAYEEYVTADAATSGMILVNMWKQRNIDKSVLSSRTKREESINIKEVVPMWYDSGKPIEGRNQAYLGYHHLFDITPFRNLRDIRGGGLNAETTYEISKLRKIATKIVVGLLHNSDPAELKAILNGINTSPSDIAENLARVSELSRQFHEAYLPELRRIREEDFGGAFLLSSDIQRVHEISYDTTASSVEYESRTIEEINRMLVYNKRNPQRTIRSFALSIGFREMEANEDADAYLKELFLFSGKLFNNNAWRMQDYGNGEFDYISATQLGRGFAQVMMGTVEEGLSLKQSPKAPINAAAASREERDALGLAFEPETPEGEIATREFLRPNVTNISFFAPMSMYEQNRAYDDFRLTRRMRHILNTPITQKMRDDWAAFIAVNKEIEFRNKIRELKLQRRDAINAKDASMVASIDKLIFNEQKVQKEYENKQFDLRTELGRVQRYNLMLSVNNRDLYTRIPTNEEAIEMSMEIALNLPQYIAVHVHDSENYRVSESGIYLDSSNPTYFSEARYSNGGPTGSTLLPGVSSQIAFVMNNPGVLTDDLVRISLRNGVRAAQNGAKFSKSTYFDTSYNGLHHLLLLHMTYFPESAVSEREGRRLDDFIAKSLSKDNVDESGVITKKYLKDYYEACYTIFVDEAIPQQTKLILNNTQISEEEKEKKLAQLERIKGYLASDQSTTRDFMKGIILPKMYKGGYKAIVEGMQKRQGDTDSTSELRKLTLDDIKLIATSFCVAVAGEQTSLVNKVLDLDPEAVNNLAGVLLENSKTLTTNVRAGMQNLLENNEELLGGYIGAESVKLTIDARIKQVAQLLIPPNIPFSVSDESPYQKELQSKTIQIRKKWDKRIKDAGEYLKSKGGQIAINSKEEQEFKFILAGGASGYKTQATLQYINKMQNAGFKLNDSHEAQLNARVRTGRYIDSNDLMYQAMTIFPTVGIGSTTGRMQYAGNNATNFHSGSLSKGRRLVYKDDGTLDLKESLQDSMWELVGNPLTGQDPIAAKAQMEDLAIKHLSLILATDYTPNWMGYSEDQENTSKFFKAWFERSDKERNYMIKNFAKDRESMKELFRQRQRDAGILESDIKEFTDTDIDESIASNSTPLKHRIGTRILSPLAGSTNLDDTVMTLADAKGMGAFIPRLADNYVEDRVVHGLYQMYRGVQESRDNLGSLRNVAQKVMEEKESNESLLKMQDSYATQYDPDQLPFIPASDSSLVSNMVGAQSTIHSKTLALQFTLDSFAIQNGFNDLVKTKQYARLYQIYKVDMETKKLFKLIGDSNKSTTDLQFLYRHYVLQLWNITKAFRDAGKAERSILDFCKSMGIDPSMFRDKEGNNLRWIDTLIVLGELGISETQTIRFGISPTQFVMLGTDNEASNSRIQSTVIKDSNTTTEPSVVQGRDVADLIVKVFADDIVKKEATKFCKQLVAEGRIKSFAYDETGKFALLSSIPVEFQEQILNQVLANEELTGIAIDNLNLYAEVTVYGDKDRRVRFLNAKEHPMVPGVFAVPRGGIGDLSVSRKVQGQSNTRFYLTAEDIKRMLVSVRNSPLLTRIEVSQRTNKSIGGDTMQGLLKDEGYNEFLERNLQRISEETEMLTQLQSNIVLGKTDRMKDELGNELNLYDSEHYYLETVSGLTPFRASILAPITASIQKGSLYPSLSRDVKILSNFVSGVNITSGDKIAIGFAIQLKRNSPDLSHEQVIILVSEFMSGLDLKDKIEKDILPKADEILAIMDKINHSSFKGPNIFRGFVLKLLEENPDFDLKEHQIGNLINVFARSSGTDPAMLKRNNFPNLYEEFAQAFYEVKDMMDIKRVIPTKDQGLTSEDIINLGTNPDLFEGNIENGLSLNTQIQTLENEGVITPEVAVFYRTMIANVLKRNPELGKFLSISTEDLGNNQVGSAVKNGDKFTIKLNSRLMKNMSASGQVKVFAHELSHIMRLAYIADNSPEWRHIESLLRSKKGRQTIEVMLLALNGNMKYDGFDKEVDYFVSHPEEFAAQWGSWILLTKTFSGIGTILQSRSKDGKTINDTWKKAVNHMQMEVNSILAGMDNIDIKTLTEITEMAENMFAFSSSVKREIVVGNANQSLALIRNIDNIPLTNQETTRYVELLKLKETSLVSSKPLTASETLELTNLGQRHTNGTVYYNGITPEAMATRRETRIGEQQKLNYIAPPYHTLDSIEKAEIGVSFAEESIRGCNKVASANSTMGGLTRNAAEAIPLIGKPLTDYILSGRDVIMNLGQTGSERTFGSPNAIISALMYIIGDTLSVHQGQYLTDSGSSGIRENRTFTKMFVERVTNESNNLRLITNDDQYVSLQKWALGTALNVVLPMPTGITPEQEKQAKILSHTLQMNMVEMKNLIHGGNAKLYEDALIGWDVTQIGVISEFTSKKKAELTKANRKTVFNAMRELIKKNITDGACSSEFLYISGITPRCNQIYREDGDGRDSTFVEELLRVNQDKDSIAFLREATVQHLIESGPMTSGDAEDKVARLFDNGFATPTADDKITLKEVHKATINIYNAFQNQATIRAACFKLKISSETMHSLQATIVRSLDAPASNTTSGKLFGDELDETLPFGVYSGKNKSSFILDNQGTENLDFITQSVLNRMGEKGSYLFKGGLVTGAQLIEHKTLSKFISHRSNISINDIENSHGFRALSRQAIERVTGIHGYDIYEIIDALRGMSTNLNMPQNERALFKSSLDVIEQKLKIEQNMRDIGDQTETEFLSKMMLRYGPEITSMVFGPNLNTASLLNEGLVGAVVSQLYGGNSAGFLMDALGGVVKDWFGNLFMSHLTKLEQRAYARNFLAASDHANQDSKALGAIADHMFDGNLTKMQKYKSWRRQINSTMYKRLNGALVNQAQIILVKSLNNGDLMKLKGIFGRDASLASGITADEPMENQDHIKRDLKKAKVRKINAHYAYIIKQSGLLEGNRLDIYKWMLKNIPSIHIRNGTLDFQSALRWIETYNWTATKNRVPFSRAEAYQTMKALYDTTKSFRDIAMVESNPWDANTHTGSLRVVAAVFKQYPNIWVNQHLVRRGALMGHRDYVAVQLSMFIGELMYNLMLMIAAGFIEWSDLKFWEKESKLNKNPLILSNLIISRNPIFGAGLNLLSQAVHQVLMQQQRQAERYPQGPNNEIKNTQGIVGDVADSITMVGGVPATAIGMLLKNSAALYQVVATEGNMNEQEIYDAKAAGFSTLNAFVPGFGELFFRLMQKQITGSRPERRGISVPGSGQYRQTRQGYSISGPDNKPTASTPVVTGTPQPKPKTRNKELPRLINTPIPVPPSFPK